MGQKGFTHILALVLLLAAVGFGAVMIQSPKIFQSRADTPLSWDAWNATYNKCQGQPGYNSRYDFSGENGARDNCVNGYDYATFITMLYAQPTPTSVPQPTPTPAPQPTSIPVPTTPVATPTLGAPQPISADIDVTYIERTPRYYRYCVHYPNDLPALCPGTENQKRWPDVGENITYKAHVLTKKNSVGNLTLGNAQFTYQWLANNGVVASGQSAVPSSGETVVEYSTTWPANPNQIQFKIIANSAVSGDISANNSLTINSHALTLSIWAERGFYDIFNNNRNFSGTYSFEDWVEAHFAKMNERFTQAQYSTLAPNGIRDRVRLDKIVVAENLDGGSAPMNSDPDVYLIDGRWQFSDDDSTNSSGRSGNWQNYVNGHIGGIDWGYIHEMSHQLGIIDLYRMNLPNDSANNNRIQVKDRNGNIIPFSALPTYAYGQILFQYPGLMGGGDRSPYTEGSWFESHTAAGMNSHGGMRRGFFGEYLYDTPANSSIKLLDKSGHPIVGAEVKLYQKDDRNNEVFDNYPEISGTTDTLGVMALPNRDARGVTTVTGHTLRPNPFGQISNVGTNGSMIIQVIKDNKEGYGFLILHDLNIAYWSGNRELALITIKTNYDSGLPVSSTPIPTRIPIPTPTRVPTPPPGALVPSPTPPVTPPQQTGTTSPVIYSTYPYNLAVVKKNSQITLSATAADSRGIKNIDFYIGSNTNPVCSDASAPFSCLWQVPNSVGFYQLKVKVYNTLGKDASKTVSFFAWY